MKTQLQITDAMRAAIHGVGEALRTPGLGGSVSYYVVEEAKLTLANIVLAAVGTDEPGGDDDAQGEPVRAMSECVARAAVDAVQALRQSTALTQLLIAKGILTQAEIDERMRSTEELANSLMALAVQMKGGAVIG